MLRGWLAVSELLSLCVIPAPLGSEGAERGKAGTHAPGSLLLERTTRATMPPHRNERGSLLGGAWVPAWSRSGLSGPRGAGMTLGR